MPGIEIEAQGQFCGFTAQLQKGHTFGILNCPAEREIRGHGRDAAAWSCGSHADNAALHVFHGPGQTQVLQCLFQLGLQTALVEILARPAPLCLGDLLGIGHRSHCQDRRRGESDCLAHAVECSAGIRADMHQHQIEVSMRQTDRQLR